MIFYLIGFMGAGKSTVGKYAARHNDLEFIDLDSYIEEFSGKTVGEIFDLEGEGKFREIERDCLRKVTRENDGVLVSCGGGTPCFHENMDFMNAHGETIYLDLSSGRLTDRLRNAKVRRPLLDEIKGDLQVWIHQKLMERAEFYAQAKHILPQNRTDKKSVSKLIARLLEQQD